jgi:protein-tyrosine-phosphatase
MPVPLFVCQANCCRSVLARYLYEHLFPQAHALGAGLEAGDQINARAAEMLHAWGIDCGGHHPLQLRRPLCDQAGAIFVMDPEHVRRLLAEHGGDLAHKTYLFADPFSLPRSFRHGEYRVPDPSFERRPVAELLTEFGWFRERVDEIHEVMLGRGRAVVPATRYLDKLEELDEANRRAAA